MAYYSGVRVAPEALFGGTRVTTDPNSSFDGIARSVLSSLAESFSSASGLPPRSTLKSEAARREAPNPEVAKRAVAPAIPSPQTVTLEGIADGKTLGGYSLSYAAGQLMVSSSQNGGSYGVDSLPIGEWFVLADGRGFPLPVAIQRTRMDAYCVRVDRAPLQGLRALTSYPGWVPTGTSASPNPPTPQQQRQNDQMALQALRAGSNAENQAAMNTARHLHS
jgi:hypothetical protein